MKYTSHTNNIFYNYGLANVLFYMRNIKNKNISYEDITFENMLEAAKYFYNGFTTLKTDSEKRSVSNKNMTISFKYENVHKYSGNSTNKKANGRYLPANVIATDKSEGVLIKLWEKLNDSKELASGKTIKLTKSCFPLAGKYLMANSTAQNNANITCEEFLCYLITTITPFKPSFLLENNPTCIIPDFSLEDTYEWLKCFSYSFESFYNSNKIEVQLSKAGEHSNPTRNGNYIHSGKNQTIFLRDLYLISNMYELLRNNKEELRNLLDLLLIKNERNLVFYIFNTNTCYVHKYSHHVAKLSREQSLKPILDSLLSSFRKTYLFKNNLNSIENFKEYNMMQEMFERDIYNFSCRMDDSSLRQINSKRILFTEETQKLFKYYYTNLKNMKNKDIESATEIAETIRTRYKGRLYSELKNTTTSEKDLHQKVDLQLSKYIDEFTSYVDRRVSTTDFVRMFHRFCRDSKNSTISIKNMSFIDSLLKNEIELQDAKNLIISMLRINIVKSKEDKIDKEEVDEMSTPTIE